MKRFELEQDILSCWNVTDDMKLLYTHVLEDDMSKDAIANVLLGLVSLYDMKFDKCFKTFEAMLKE